MPRELTFAWYAIKKNIQNSAELRASFLMNIVGMMINNTSFIVLWVFFARSVGTIGGWTAADIVGLNGFMALCFGLVYSVFAGIRKLPDMVTSGSFDRLLLSPKNLLLRTVTSSRSVSALGEIVFGVLCLGIYAALIDMTWQQIATMPILVALSTGVFFSVALCIHSMSFFFSDAHSVTMSLHELFLTPSMFHGGAFDGWLRFAFTFVVPSLLIGTIPVEIVRDLSWEKLAVLGLLCAMWLSIAIAFFFFAVRRYESANGMTFGD
jgi:ABC-2 type transport system permease protein